MSSVVFPGVMVTDYMSEVSNATGKKLAMLLATLLLLRLYCSYEHALKNIWSADTCKQSRLYVCIQERRKKLLWTSLHNEAYKYII